MNKRSCIIAILVWIACLSHTGCVNETKDHPQTNQAVGNNYSALNQQANYAEADTTLLQKAELTKIYTKAIAEFIRAANKKNETAFDTLCFANRKNGQPDDFPDITAIVDAMVTSTATQVQTTHAGTGVIDKFINKTQYDTLIAP